MDSTTGKILWRFGGKKSDFTIASTAKFAWQHDVEYEDATTLRMFDNGTDGTVTVSKESRSCGSVWTSTPRTTTLIWRFTHPDKVSALAMGNAQRLSNGNVMVGWGTAQRISEFDSDGTLLFDAKLPQLSYRAYRAVWRT